MFAEQGDNRNRIKDICLFSILTAVCIVFGFIESLIPTFAIAPGIKLGISNSVALLLIIGGNIKGAFLVNVSRILLSALLFGSPFSLVFSLVAGLVSMLVCFFVNRFKNVGAIGVSISGAVAHNITQTVIAFFVLNTGVFYYLPILILSAMISGGLIGAIAEIISQKTKKNIFYSV